MHGSPSSEHCISPEHNQLRSLRRSIKELSDNMPSQIEHSSVRVQDGLKRILAEFPATATRIAEQVYSSNVDT